RRARFRHPAGGGRLARRRTPRGDGGRLPSARPAGRGAGHRRRAARGRGLKVHLMGAGGTGVSSLALVLAARGETVSGCDARRSETTELLEKAGIPVALGHDPTHVNGIAVLVGDGRSTRTGRARWLVAEADESDGSLALHHPGYAIVTNLELDHPDFFPDLAAVREVFQRFAGQVSELAVACADDAEVMSL